MIPTTNKTWGFYGAVASQNEFGRKEMEEVWAAAFDAVKAAHPQLSDEQVREFLDSSSGRHYADALTFHYNSSDETTPADVIQAIAKDASSLKSCMRSYTRKGEAKGNLVSVTVTYEDGSTTLTSVNGDVSDDEIRDYFVGKRFDMGPGDGPEKMVKCTGVEIDRGADEVAESAERYISESAEDALIQLNNMQTKIKLNEGREFDERYESQFGVDGKTAKAQLLAQLQELPESAKKAVEQLLAETAEEPVQEGNDVFDKHKKKIAISTHNCVDTSGRYRPRRIADCPRARSLRYYARKKKARTFLKKLGYSDKQLAKLEGSVDETAEDGKLDARDKFVNGPKARQALSAKDKARIAELIRTTGTKLSQKDAEQHVMIEKTSSEELADAEYMAERFSTWEEAVADSTPDTAGEREHGAVTREHNRHYVRTPEWKDGYSPASLKAQRRNLESKCVPVCQGVAQLMQEAGCPQCELLRINGVLCHEKGCPEAWRDETRECKECGCEFVPTERKQVYCHDLCGADSPAPPNDSEDIADLEESTSGDLPHITSNAKSVLRPEEIELIDRIYDEAVESFVIIGAKRNSQELYNVQLAGMKSFDNKFSAQLKLWAIHDLAFDDESIAMSDYPEMEGDWSAIRDSSPETVDKIFRQRVLGEG